MPSETYEIINPSDPVTFVAEDDKVAVWITLFLGSGKYEAEKSDGTHLGALMLFCSEKEVEERLKKMYPEGVMQFGDDHTEQILAAIETMICLSRDERSAYDAAIKRLPTSEVVAYQKEVNDKNRSSLNNIVGAAQDMANALRRRANKTGG